jgi:prepilin signal peptidase PulO-like enzyme (type II secretory pathway)
MMSTFGMLFGFMVIIVPHLLGLMGAGDVKLMAGIGAWFGFTVTATVFAATALVSGVVAVMLIVRRGELRESCSTIKMIFTQLFLVPTNLGKQDLVSVVSSGPDRRLRAIPFAAMVPIGIFVTLLCDTVGVL